MTFTILYVGGPPPAGVVSNANTNIIVFSNINTKDTLIDATPANGRYAVVTTELRKATELAGHPAFASKPIGVIGEKAAAGGLLYGIPKADTTEELLRGIHNGLKAYAAAVSLCVAVDSMESTKEQLKAKLAPGLESREGVDTQWIRHMSDTKGADKCDILIIRLRTDPSKTISELNRVTSDAELRKLYTEIMGNAGIVAAKRVVLVLPPSHQNAAKWDYSKSSEIVLASPGFKVDPNAGDDVNTSAMIKHDTDLVMEYLKGLDADLVQESKISGDRAGFILEQARTLGTESKLEEVGK